jgi:hypothetical protein
MSHESYSVQQINGLLHGEVERRVPLTGDVVTVPARSWAAIRSDIEYRGDVEQPAFHEVMDLERSLEQLAQRHPDAAAIVILRLWGFDHGEFNTVLPKSNWRRVARKGAAWIAAYLSGDDAEKAYRGTR